MRESQRSQCCDVRVLVLRSADCWTDHKLLRGQLKIKVSTKREQAVTWKRFNVCGLKREKVRERFVEKAKELVEEGWDGVSSGEEMWEAIRASMVDAAEVMGREEAT